MTSILTAQIAANLVIMARTVDTKKSALLIEGDKDSRVYRKVVSAEHCQIVAAGNRSHAEGALAILKKARQPGVLAVVDADTDHLQGKPSGDPDLILTHTRDVDCMLITKPVLHSLLIEFDLGRDAFGPDPELAVARAAASLAYIKYIVQERRWRVRTSQFDFSVFIDPVTLACDPSALCRHAASLTLTPGITSAEYEKAFNALSAAGHEPLRVARGHDITSLLAWAILIRVGRKKKDGAKIEGHLIESYLRMAYPEAEFALTELFRKIDEWESRNTPYLVLRR